MRPDTTDPVEIELTEQEDMFGGEHTIDFIQGDVEIKKTGMYFIIGGPQIGKTSGDQVLIFILNFTNSIG